MVYYKKKFMLLMLACIAIFFGCTVKVKSVKDESFNHKIIKVAIVPIHNNMLDQPSVAYIENICTNLSSRLSSNYNIDAQNIRKWNTTTKSMSDNARYLLSVSIVSSKLNIRYNTYSYTEEVVLFDTVAKREIWKAMVSSEYNANYEEIVNTIIEQLKKDSLI